MLLLSFHSRPQPQPDRETLAEAENLGFSEILPLLQLGSGLNFNASVSRLKENQSLFICCQGLLTAPLLKVLINSCEPIFFSFLYFA